MKFEVITGKTVALIIDENLSDVVDIVGSAYLAFHKGEAVNPDSYFLRFPDRPNSRIIALPAHIDSEMKVSGIKWISSFPDNIKANIPRASAALLLNDYETGYPFACLESSIISAARTAASATLAANLLGDGNRQIRNLGIIGTGLIARYILRFLIDSGWKIDCISLYDLEHAYAQKFQQRIYSEFGERAPKVKVDNSIESTISNSDMLVLATTAAAPHIHDFGLLSHNPLILHISLRDLSPEIILSSHNVVDDVDHCLKANTSLHLAEQTQGNRKFIDANIAQIMESSTALGQEKPIIFSPFGMGILDLALGYFIYQKATASGDTKEIVDFFYELDRV